MLAYVFSGQGAQSRGMGKGLFERYPELTEIADNILGYSIKELCLEDPNRQLNKTQFTQPALFFVNALTYYSKLDDTGEKPDYLAGHSLGEFNALLAAGCFNLETGLKLVKKRGELMSNAPKGGMAAILNLTKDSIVKTLQNNNLTNIDIANYNTRTQIVISGPSQDIEKAEKVFQENDVKFYTLNTDGAFHSRYMQPIKENFKAYIKGFKLVDLKIPVISNVTALPYKNDRIVENIVNQISSCVLWSESVYFLLEEARRTGETLSIEEVGHGEVLTKIISRIMDEEIKLTPPNDKKNSEAAQSLEHADNIKNEQSISALEKVERWNNQHSVGTKVRSVLLEREDLETRTNAMVLLGHRAVVYMKGYKGYFDLNEIQPR